MTRLLVDLPEDRDAQVLIPLLHRLRIPFQRVETAPRPTEAERAEALRIIRKGCDMASFGDALEYRQRVREDRALLYREA